MVLSVPPNCSMAFYRETALDYLRRAHGQDRLGHAYLISGPPGSGKRALAAELTELVNGTDRKAVFSARAREVYVAEPESKSRRIVTEQVRELEHALHMRAEGDRRKVAICFWIVKPWLSRLRFQNHPDSFIGCAPGERRMAGEQLIKDCAKSVNISCAREPRLVTSGLLGRHVTRRSQYLQSTRDRALCFHQPRQTEVSQMRFTFSIDHYVSRLDVAMQNAVLVCVMNGARQLSH